MAISDLNNKINQAVNLLTNNTYKEPEEGSDPELTGQDANRYFKVATLIESYRNDLDFTEAIESLARINSSIRTMRSSYLPIDFYPRNPNLDKPGAKDQPTRLTGAFQDLESYENAFMRMLGMPLSSQVEIASVNPNAQTDSETFITADAAGLLIYDIDKEKALKVSFDLSESAEQTEKSVREHILNERQRKREDRKVPLGNEVYVTTYTSVIVSSDPESILKVDTDRVKIDLSKLDGGDFIKASYLLVPPIQDSTISKCINEPKKIVPLPFENPYRQTVNSIRTVPSLLETIIKIRLDKATGSMKLQNPVGDGEETEQADADADSFGFVESLFIVRLRAALGGIANKMVDDLDDLITTYEETQRLPNPANSDENAAIQTDKETVAELTGIEIDSLNTEAEFLEARRLTEDAIISLLNENLKIPELLNRNSSTISDSQLISALLGVVDVPRQNIIDRINEINSKRNKKSDLDETPKKTIDLALGLDIGVGVCHIIIFALALFTIPEDSLLGLLSEKQFENLKTHPDYKNLVEPSRTKRSTLESVNELSRYIIDGFNLFEQELANSANESFLDGLVNS